MIKIVIQTFILTPYKIYQLNMSICSFKTFEIHAKAVFVQCYSQLLKAKFYAFLSKFDTIRVQFRHVHC